MTSRSWRSPRRLITTSLLAVVLVGVGGLASAATPQPAIKTITPKYAEQVTNIDVLRQQLRNYYGDPLGSGIAAPDGNYADEARKVAAAGRRWLDAVRHQPGENKAIVLDVDDTTLLTWNYEVFSNWAYNPATNGQFVTEQRFPAVFGMVDLVRYAQEQGFAVFFLTGRPLAQEPATLGNLTSDGVGVDAGYPTPTTLVDGEDGLFTKPPVAQYPDYLKAACAGDPNGSCTTIHYKSATRAHIESLGYDIVANFGDQFSDLEGGYADRTFKLPNPNYFLP
ncbi:MAG: acid phosphatase [Hamadaea sp.]|uniref:HAD family acid phosphatase n=1 Tax=Hamadaea sp. TaxID=2024425 RepID=UPI0017B5C0D8|nr:HAD family acid phosphatase [Hamadaea sp.]NUT20963.1 acid phosphatase [Hamadaea sp.]